MAAARFTSGSGRTLQRLERRNVLGGIDRHYRPCGSRPDRRGGLCKATWTDQRQRGSCPDTRHRRWRLDRLRLSIRADSRRGRSAARRYGKLMRVHYLRSGTDCPAGGPLFDGSARACWASFLRGAAGRNERRAGTDRHRLWQRGCATRRVLAVATAAKAPLP